jgi:hypothetical protein
VHPSLVYRVKVKHQMVSKSNQVIEFKCRCVLKIVHNEFKTGDNIVIYKNNKTILPSSWLEVVCWSTIQSSDYYGHFNFKDPLTGNYYTAIFMPYYHSTFHKLIGSVFYAHDRTGRPRQDDDARSSGAVYNTCSVMWPDVILSHFCQVIFCLLLPNKSKYSLCHNDLKLDNIVYQKTKLKEIRVCVQISHKLKNMIFTQYELESLDKSAHCKDYIQLVLKIPTYQRVFYMIDFGWTHLVLPKRHGHDKQISASHHQELTSKKDESMHVEEEQEDTTRNACQEPPDNTTEKPEAHQKGHYTLQQQHVDEYIAYCSDMCQQFNHQDPMVFNNKLLDIGQMCTALFRMFIENKFINENNECYRNVIEPWKHFINLIHKASLTDLSKELDYLDWNLPMYTILSRHYNGTHLLPLLKHLMLKHHELHCKEENIPVVKLDDLYNK